MVFVDLQPEVVNLLACPNCKGDLHFLGPDFRCEKCGLLFPLKKIQVGERRWEYVYDFRLHRPAYCVPIGIREWQRIQSRYEGSSNKRQAVDSIQFYEEEINSVREIYTQEFQLNGTILDVGGNQGRLRHWIRDGATLYLSIDPRIDVFSGIDKQPNLTKVYPSLLETCNFLAAHAEHLPFKTGSFDWLHMRSVIDHFEDPYLALLEAYRCAKRGGKLLVGLSIIEKKGAKFSDSPISSFTATLRRVLNYQGMAGILTIIKQKANALVKRDYSFGKSDHMYRLRAADLLDLMKVTGWAVVKQHWQKPPYDYCIYVSAEALKN